MTPVVSGSTLTVTCDDVADSITLGAAGNVATQSVRVGLRIPHR